MIRVQLESPYAVPMSAEERERFPELAMHWRALHREYLHAALRDSLLRGEAPFASHGLYTEALNDDVEAERALGIGAGLVYLRNAERHVFYLDLFVHDPKEYGEDYVRWSKGMKLARQVGDELGIPSVTRKISPLWTDRSLDLFRRLHSLRAEQPTT